MNQGYEISFSSGDAVLAGTLALPDTPGPYPAVLMIVGSGPVDRDENAAKIHIDAFSQIAAHLAEHGIASFRYDKRGVGASGGDFWSTGLEDTFVDANAALTALEQQPEIDSRRVFVLGHSEGASHAIRLAASRSELAGAILLAGSAVKGEIVLTWQAEQVIRGMHGFNKWVIDTFRIDALKSQRKSFAKIRNSTADTIRVQLVQKLNAKWFREFLDFDPAEDLARVTIPVLAITGSKDIQVNPADLEIMRRLVKGEFESHLVPDLTHILRADEGEPTLSTYKEQAKRPVDSRVLELVSDWVERH